MEVYNAREFSVLLVGLSQLGRYLSKDFSVIPRGIVESGRVDESHEGLAVASR